MNKENILELARFIETEAPERDLDFEMPSARYNTDCGTAGCIGGHAALLWSEVRCSKHDTDERGSFDDIKLAAKLGIECGQITELCYEVPADDIGPIGLGQVTREAAVDALRHLAETGKVRFLQKLCRRTGMET